MGQVNFKKFEESYKEFPWRKIILALLAKLQFSFITPKWILSIQEALRDYGAIWYMDTSIILEKGDLRHVHALVTCRAKPRIKFV